MNKLFGALIAAAALATATAAPAMAQECSASGHTKVASGYVMQDLGPEKHGSVATDNAVNQGGATLTCGKVSYDVWYSLELSEEGEVGNRGYGDEVDLTVMYNDTVATPFGKLTFEGSASIYLLSSFGEIRDDMLQFYADVGYPIEVGPVTITPFVRPIQWVGLGAIPDESLVRAGTRFAVPLGDGWSIDGDVSMNFLLTSDRSHARGQVNLRKNLFESWSMAGEVKLTEGAPTVYAIGVAKPF